MPPADRKATPRFLQRLAYDVLQRSMSPREASAYLGADVATVVPRLLHTREAMEAWFEEQIFYFLLLDNFRPKGEVVERIPARLQKDQLTARDAIGELLLSTGFTLRNPGNDTFVSVVLEQCLGYKVQDARVKPILEAGKKIYDGKKGRFLGGDGQSQSDLLQIVLHHRDFSQHLLDREHQRLLGTPLPKDAPELTALHADAQQFFPLVGQWLQGDGYWQNLAQKKPKNDRQFVRGLYMDLLERVPTHDELRNMRNAMQSMADPAPLRAVMAKVILDSGQAKLPQCASGEEAKFATECFLRYLAREPGPQELTVFSGLLQRSEATPTHVVRALVGSLEYQNY